jgi:hypothetical protein
VTFRLCRGGNGGKGNGRVRIRRRRDGGRIRTAGLRLITTHDCGEQRDTDRARTQTSWYHLASVFYLGNNVLRHLVRENVQMIRDALRILRFFQVTRGARAEFKAGGETLEPQNVFEREDRTRLGVVEHERFSRDQVCVTLARVGPPMHST